MPRSDFATRTRHTRDKALTKILAAAGRGRENHQRRFGDGPQPRTTIAIPTDLAKLIESSLVLLEREMQKYRIQIEDAIRTGAARASCGNEIQQVLLNLLTNARQAMPRGGQILSASLPTQPTTRSTSPCAIRAAAFRPRVSAANLRPLLLDQARARPAAKAAPASAWHVPRDHRIAPGQNPRREHGWRRHRVHAQTADRQSRNRAYSSAAPARPA